MAVAKASDVFLPHLRAWRADRGMTQEELAKQADVARGTILRAENGSALTILSAAKLAKALGVSVHELQTVNPLTQRPEGGA